MVLKLSPGPPDEDERTTGYAAVSKTTEKERFDRHSPENRYCHPPFSRYLRR
jgi:hypothetical protein